MKRSTEDEILDRVKTGEKWMIWLTALIFATGAFQAYETWSNNRSTSAQTDQMIAASKYNAYAADRNAQAASNFAQSARNISQGVDDAVGQLNSQSHEIESSRESATLAANNALSASVESAIRQERAWIGVEKATPTLLERDNTQGLFKLSVTFSVRNYGHSAADHVRISSALVAEKLNDLGRDVCAVNPGGLPGDVLIPGQAHHLSVSMNLPILDVRNVFLGRDWSHDSPTLGKGALVQLQGCIWYSDSSTPTLSYSTPFTYFLAKAGGLVTADTETTQGDQLFLILSPTGVGHAQ